MNNLPGQNNENPDASKDIKSIRSVLDSTLGAMSRLKESCSSFNGRIMVLEANSAGIIERIETLEKVIHMLMEGAPEKLKEFLEKASDEDSETKALAGGTPSDEEIDAEVVG